MKELAELKRTHLDGPMLASDAGADEFLRASRLVHVRPAVADGIRIPAPKERLGQLDDRLGRPDRLTDLDEELQIDVMFCCGEPRLVPMVVLEVVPGAELPKVSTDPACFCNCPPSVLS
ncbi:MAG: hypothetical protein GY745_09230 [Actinomycetia bacterium]|nr:hypothetical protein [Actinomycetes bacterium]